MISIDHVKYIIYILYLSTLNQYVYEAVKTQVTATQFLLKDHPLKFSLVMPATIKHTYIHTVVYIAQVTTKRIVRSQQAEESNRI